MSTFLTALGLVLVIEGVLYALFPRAARRFMAAVLSEPETRLQRFGLISIVLGVTIVALVRGFP